MGPGFQRGSSTGAALASLLALAACGVTAPARTTDTTTPPGGPYDCTVSGVCLTATATGAGQVHLTWSAVRPDPTDPVPPYYDLYERGKPDLVLWTSATSADATGLSPETEHCFQVFAHGWARLAPLGQSNVACATTLRDVTPPAEVGAVATSDPAARTIRLDWTPPADDTVVAGYEISRDGAHLATVTGTSFTDASPSSGVLTCYAVVARDAGGNESARGYSACAFPGVASAVTGDASAGSIAVDPAGGIHVVYAVPTTEFSYGLRHATAPAAGGPWATTAISDDACVSPSWSLAVDAGGAAHVGFCAGGVYRLDYATDAEATWLDATVDSDWVGPFASLALDPDGNAHVSYYDHQRGSVKYATNASGAWSVATIDEAYLVRTTSLALDAAGHAHVVYHDAGARELRHATDASGAWSVEPIAAGDALDPGGIAVDGAGHVHVAWIEAHEVRYATDAAGAWASTPVTPGDAPLSLALAPDGTLYLGFVAPLDLRVLTPYGQEAAGGERFTYAAGANGAWTIHPTGAWAISNSARMTLDGAGLLHVVYGGSGAGLRHAVFAPR